VTGVTVVGVRGHLVAVEAHVGRGFDSSFWAEDAVILQALMSVGTSQERLEFLG
jgi:hypothetical protein